MECRTNGLLGQGYAVGHLACVACAASAGVENHVLCQYGKRDSGHHLLEEISKTANVLELRQASIHHPLCVVVGYKFALPTI